MKNKMNSALAKPLIILLMSSCAVTEMEFLKDASTSDTFSIHTKSEIETMSREDSLRRVYEIQTNREGFLLRHIVMEDGEWKIGISRENAISLGVESGVYDFYLAYIDRINM